MSNTYLKRKKARLKTLLNNGEQLRPVGDPVYQVDGNSGVGLGVNDYFRANGKEIKTWDVEADASFVVTVDVIIKTSNSAGRSVMVSNCNGELGF